MTNESFEPQDKSLTGPENCRTDFSPVILPSADLPHFSEASALSASLPLDAVQSPPPLSRQPAHQHREPGPGLLEALGWTMGVFLAHVLATVGLIIVIAAIMAFTGELEGIVPDLEAAPTSYILLLLGGDQFLVLAISVMAVMLRYWGRVGTSLNLSLPHPLQVLLIAGLMLPLSSLCGELYRQADLLWLQIVENIPFLSFLNGASSMEILSQISQAAPLPVMVMIIAVAPALAEELVFRGVIGRGLVARWGLWTGVLVSSVLFALVHFHPVHVIAVIPLGIAMHLVYLATRSFWAPVLLHFLNNTWATVASRLSPPGEVEQALASAPSAGLLVASGVAVIVLGAFLFHIRTRYLLPDGSEWSPGYVTAEAPPEDLDARLDRGIWTGRTLATAAAAWTAFAIAFVAEIVAFAR